MISQTLFSSRKDSYPTWRFFSLRAPSSCYFGISNNWPWNMGVGCEYLLELHTQIKSARTSVFILTKSDFQLYVQPNSLDGPLIGTVHIVVLQCSRFLFKANCMCAQKQVAKFITVIYVCFASQGRAWHCESFGTIPLAFDSLL